MPNVKTENKLTNSIPVVISNPNFLGNSINFNFSGNNDVAQRVCFSHSMLNLLINVTNTNVVNGQVQPYIIKRPALAWVRQYNINWADKDGKSHYEGSMQRRGEAGNAMALLEGDLANTEDFAMLNYLIAPITVTVINLQVALQLRYLIDMFGPEKWLAMMNGTFNLDFLPVEDCFEFPIAQAGWKVTCTACNLLYDVADVDMKASDPFYLNIDPRQIYTQTFGVLPGTTTNTLNLTPPGGLLFLIIYFGNLGTQGGQGGLSIPNLYNAWDYALPNYIQLQNLSSKAYPPNPAYPVDNTAPYMGGNDYSVANRNPAYNPQLGWTRMYRELMSVISKMAPKANTYVTGPRWLSDYRFYAIECSDNKVSNATYVLNMNMNAAIPTLVNATMFGVYLKTNPGNSQYAVL